MAVVYVKAIKGKPPKPPGKPGKAFIMPAAGGSFALWMARNTGGPVGPEPVPVGRSMLAAVGSYRANIAFGNWDDVHP